MFDFFIKDMKGDKEEFIRLLEGPMKVLYKIAYSYFREKEAASDAIQDTILNAYKNFHKLKDREKFRSWITSILVNDCRQKLRKGKKINFEEYSENIIDINKFTQGNKKSEYIMVEDRIDILNLLSRIDDKYREVISLKYLGDYTIEEISLILDIPEGTVKSRLNFGIKRLRTLMEVKIDVV